MPATTFDTATPVADKKRDDNQLLTVAQGMLVTAIALIMLFVILVACYLTERWHAHWIWTILGIEISTMITLGAFTFILYRDIVRRLRNNALRIEKLNETVYLAGFHAGVETAIAGRDDYPGNDPSIIRRLPVGRATVPARSRAQMPDQVANAPYTREPGTPDD